MELLLCVVFLVSTLSTGFAQVLRKFVGLHVGTLCASSGLILKVLVLCFMTIIFKIVREVLVCMRTADLRCAVFIKIIMLI